MEVSALKYSGSIGLHGRSPLLRLQSDERLINFIRRGNSHAFEVLLARYESRLLAFCRHMLGSREDAEDVMQEVMTAAFNAIVADDRPINVRPWLYRIARNRSLNHLRRIRAIGVDSMDVHFANNGASTAEVVHEREEFRLLVGDIHELPETQKTALVLREMDALSYDQIAEAMETTVPSVKSLLVRARVSLAEAAEARLLSCDEVRIELGEVAEGLRRRPSPLVRRHLRQCDRCTVFRTQLKQTNKALAALMPIGSLVVLKKLLLAHLGHSAGAGSGATAGATAAGSGSAGAAGTGAVGAGAVGTGVASSGVAGTSVAVGGGALAGTTAAAGTSGFISAGLGAIATKAAAGLAAAAIVTAGAVEVDHSATRPVHHATPIASVVPAHSPAQQASVSPLDSHPQRRSTDRHHRAVHKALARAKAARSSKPAAPDTTKPTPTTAAKTPAPPAAPAANTQAALPGRDQTQTDPTVLPPSTPADSQPTAAPAPTDTSGQPTTTTTSPSPTPTPTPTPTSTPAPTTTPVHLPTPPSPLPTTPGSPLPEPGHGPPPDPTGQPPQTPDPTGQPPGQPQQTPDPTGQPQQTPGSTGQQPGSTGQPPDSNPSDPNGSGSSNAG